MNQRRFDILRQIASGGFGSVFLTRLTQGDGFSRIVAVKLLHPQWSENEEVAKRMRDEARLLGLLRHRNIIEVVDLTRLDGRVAVVMEYLEAIDCKAIIADLRSRGQVLPTTAALQLISQAASALDAAYNKAPYEGERPLRVVHRDIKPSNLMVDAQGVVKVLDFGVARGEFDAREAETKGMAFGSFDYMPSERRFMEPGGETTDVYSLAVVLFEMLTGEAMGKGRLKAGEHATFIDQRVEVMRKALEDAPPAAREELCAFVTDMLAFEPEERPTPNRVVATFRRLGRVFADGTLEEWAEDHVPPLLAALRARQQDSQSDPLVGEAIIEDRFTTMDRNDGVHRPHTDPGVLDEHGNVIPKRVRDAAPARPPISGTVTPAPLRRRNTPTPPVASTPSYGSTPVPVMAEPAPPAGRGILFYVVIIVGLLTLLGGALTLLGAVVVATGG